MAGQRICIDTILRVGLGWPQSRIKTEQCRAIGAKNRVLAAHVEVDVRVILWRGHTDAVEFPHPDTDLRSCMIVSEFRIFPQLLGWLCVGHIACLLFAAGGSACISQWPTPDRLGERPAAADAPTAAAGCPSDLALPIYGRAVYGGGSRCGIATKIERATTAEKRTAAKRSPLKLSYFLHLTIWARALPLKGLSMRQIDSTSV